MSNWKCGWQWRFRIWFSHDYYDTEFYTLQLGFFWIAYGPYGLPLT